MPTSRAPRGPQAALLVALLGFGCSEPAPPPTPPRVPRLDRTATRALREWALAGYEMRALGERPGPPPEEALGTLQATRERARGELERALVAEGADPARARDEAQLLPLVHEAARGSGRYALLLGDDPASFSLVRVAREEPERSLRLFGQAFQYRLLVHDETLVPDYPTWIAERAGGPVLRPASWSGDGTVRVDQAAIARLGAEQFLPQVEALRAGAGRAADPEPFRARAGEEHLPELLELARATLRWRSLESLWATLAARSRQEQLDGFVADYARRAELRAACELRELRRLHPSGGGELDAVELVRLQELGALSALIHGEPLGVAADLLALAARSLAPGAAGERAAPALLAARRLVAELAARFREGPPALEGDALALWRLCHAPPDALRAVARELHEERAR